MPISALTKEARRNFDVRDESGRSVPVLGRDHNGSLAHIALMNAIVRALPNAAEEELSAISQEVSGIVFGDADGARSVLEDFVRRSQAGDRTRGRLLADPVCRTLLSTLWSNYVLFAVLQDDSPHRRVLKYSYGDDWSMSVSRVQVRERVRPAEVARRLRHPDRRYFLVPCPGAWRAASFHVEVAVPEELRIECAALVGRGGGHGLGAAEYDVNRAALYARSEIDEEEEIAVSTILAPERTGRTAQAAGTSVVTAALIWLGVISRLDAENPGAAVSLLLAGAALFSGITAAQGEHRLVSAVFNGARRWLTVVTFAALAASATLAMEFPTRRPVGVWFAAAIVCTLASARLVWSAIRAPAYTGAEGVR